MNDMERNLGEQPLAALMLEHKLSPKDLVDASPDQMTHKMISRGTKGRRLTPNTMGKVLRALNAASKSSYALADLFNYTASERRSKDAD